MPPWSRGGGSGWGWKHTEGAGEAARTPADTPLQRWSSPTRPPPSPPAHAGPCCWVLASLGCGCDQEESPDLPSPPGPASPSPSSNEGSLRFDFSYNTPFFFLAICLFRAAARAYGGSQARGLIGATAAGLCQSHSNARSEPRLPPTPQLTAVLDPQPTEQGQGSNSQPHGS